MKRGSWVNLVATLASAMVLSSLSVSGYTLTQKNTYSSVLNDYIKQQGRSGTSVDKGRAFKWKGRSDTSRATQKSNIPYPQYQK